MLFDPKLFQKQEFTDEQIKTFFKSAERDLEIAVKSEFNEAIFTFTYQAFLKLGIALIASNGYKVKSREGHHIAIIKQLSVLLKDENIEFYGESMRRKRNVDLYMGGVTISEKETLEYRDFVENLIKKSTLINLHNNL